MADARRQDTAAPFWTLEQAALHFGITRRSVRRYIQDGLAVYFGGTMVKPAEYIQEYQERRARQRDSRTVRLEAEELLSRREGTISVATDGTPVIDGRKLIDTGTEVELLDVQGDVVRRARVWNWSESHLLHEPRWDSAPSRILNPRYFHLLWFVGDSEPTVHVPEEAAPSAYRIWLPDAQDDTAP